jgi:hypothetical protein
VGFGTEFLWLRAVLVFLAAAAAVDALPGRG